MVNRVSSFVNSILKLSLLCLHTFIVGTIAFANGSDNLILNLELDLEKAKSPSQKSQALLALSEYYMGGDLQLSAKYVQQALPLIKNLNDYKQKYSIYKQAGLVCFYTGIFDEASTYIMKSVSIANEAKDSLLIAKASFNLSALYIAIKNYELANDYLLVSKQYFDVRAGLEEFRPQILSILNNQAIVLQHTGQVDSAKKLFLDAIKFATTVDLKDGLKTTLNAFATFLINNEQYSDAEKVLLDLQILNKQHHFNLHIEATLLIKLSRVSTLLNNDVVAKEFLLKAIPFVELSQSISLYKELTNDLYLLEIKQGNELEALRYKVINDSLVRAEKAEVAIQDGIKMKMLAEFHELENEILNANKIKSRKYLYGIGLLVFVLVFFVYLLVRSVRKKRVLSNLKHKVEVEKGYLSKENHLLANEVEKKEKELTSQAIRNIRQKELLKSSIEELQKMLDQLPVASRQVDTKISQMANALEDKQAWTDFDVRFNELNSNFYTKLDTRFQNLTLNEKRLCAFLKLEMNTKEIIAITGQSVRAVEIARTRLRKKLELTNSARSLNDFFKTF